MAIQLCSIYDFKFHAHAVSEDIRNEVVSEDDINKQIDDASMRVISFLSPLYDMEEIIAEKPKVIADLTALIATCDIYTLRIPGFDLTDINNRIAKIKEMLIGGNLNYEDGNGDLQTIGTKGSASLTQPEEPTGGFRTYTT